MDLESFLAKENFPVLIIQGQILRLEVPAREVILFQGFTLSFATIITWEGGEAVWLNVWQESELLFDARDAFRAVM